VELVMGRSKPASESSSTVDSLVRRGNTMFYALDTTIRALQKRCGRKFKTGTFTDGFDNTVDGDCLCCRNEFCAYAGIRAMNIWQGYENPDEGATVARAKPEVTT
jgi:hypothetical protein